MHFLLSPSDLRNFEMKNQEYLVDTTYYELPPGEAEYRLYSYISTLYNGITILDIGTNQGRSAVALSHNPSNHVISYDIVDLIRSRDYHLFDKPNMEFHIKNVLDDITPEFLQKKNVQLVMIDICHTGGPERVIMKQLWDSGFRGMVLLDDITLNDDMKRLWNDIQWRKYDITSCGHWSGTGLVLMNDVDEMMLTR